LIGIIDYGLGNIQSFLNCFRILDVPAIPVKNKIDLQKIDRAILPGVGAFDSAIQRLNDFDLVQDLEDLVLNQSLPILGVCVGLQIMARSSEEGLKKGLAWLDADVKIINKKEKLPLPHMGWNEIDIKGNNSKLLLNLDSPRFYFLHSYYLSMDKNSDQIATTNYGGFLTAAVQKNNIYGCQFHPEKSHSSGLKVLENFSKL
tara:strand:+ start:67 stop:672 length:606 start_codon:yes stop_codon:yes gene_type:complete